MCGIHGFLHLFQNAIPEQTIFNAFMKIKHRGPDCSSFLSFDTFTVGFHRLAINDLSHIGNQPFVYHFPPIDNVIRSIYLTCNGEIYNSESLKKQFASNYKFVSSSDCEILMACFLEFGNLQDFIHNVDGEFAIAVFDVTKNKITGETTTELHLARDRFGIRPLFYTFYRNEENEIISYGYGSEMKSLIFDNDTNLHNTINVFKPRTVAKISVVNGKLMIEKHNYYSLTNDYPKLNNSTVIDCKNVFCNDDFKTACAKIRSLLLDSITIYLQSDREIGCLLSGGLDSSLVSAISALVLKQMNGKQLHTFSIGMPDSPDVINANIVAKHINSIHTNIVINENDWLDAIDKIINVTETYDITTIRATIGQYLVSKWIRENTNIKVLLVGDGSDELFGGYLYFHNAKNENDFHNECVRRLTDIHYFDVLRTDRGISANGLEARVPFLNHKLVDYVLSVNPIFRMPIYNKYIEKYILRKAFENTNLLPDSILWRPKVAFSDGVSKKEKSTHELIKEKFEKIISDDDFKIHMTTITANSVKPHSRESMYYHKVFGKLFNNNYQILKYYWLPLWCGNDVLDPSARTLTVCNEV